MSRAQQLIDHAERIARAIAERETPPGHPLNVTEMYRHRIAALERSLRQQEAQARHLIAAPRNGIHADLCGTPVLLVPGGDDWHVHAYGCIDNLLTADQWLAAGHAWDEHVKQHNSEAAIERVMA